MYNTWTLKKHSKNRKWKNFIIWSCRKRHTSHFFYYVTSYEKILFKSQTKVPRKFKFFIKIQDFWISEEAQHHFTKPRNRKNFLDFSHVTPHTLLSSFYIFSPWAKEYLLVVKGFDWKFMKIPREKFW